LSKIKASEAEQGRFGGKEWLTLCQPSRTTTRERERERERENIIEKKNKVKVKKIYIF
jgi:hypothetical protein